MKPTRCVLLSLPLTLAACSGGSSGGPISVTAPAAPSGLAATVVGTNEYLLTWTDDSLNETGFDVERGGPTSFEVVATLAPNTTSYTDLAPPRRTDWEYRIVSFNQAGDSSVSPSVFVTPTLPPPPTLSAVEPNAAFDVNTGEVRLRGKGFADFEAGTNQVTFDGVPALSVRVVDDGTLAVRPPQSAVALVDVQLTNLNGSQSIAAGFEFLAWPPVLEATDLRVDTDAPGASQSDGVRIASDGDRIYLAWAEQRARDFDVYFNRSLDGGHTWLASDVRLDTETTGLDATGIQICADGDDVYVVWSDSRGGLGDIWINRSTDAGSTWLAQEVQVDQESGGFDGAGAIAPQVACDGANVVVAWQDDRFFFRDIYTNSSTDGGLTWMEEDVRLDGGFGFSEDPQIARDGDVVAVAWHDDRNGLHDVYVNVSADGGASWQSAPTRQDTDRAGSGASINPRLAVEGQRVYVAWIDQRAIFGDVYANRSLDAGATWLHFDRRVDTDGEGAAESRNVRIAAEDDVVVIAWEDQRDNLAPRYRRSLDALESFEGGDAVLAPGAVAFNLEIAISAGNLYAVWEDDRAGMRDVFLMSSPDLGLTFQPMDLRVSADAPGASASRRPRLSPQGARVYAVWGDFRNGKQDVFFRRSASPAAP